MAVFISIFLSFIACLISSFSFYYARRSSDENYDGQEEILRVKQQLNETNDRFAQLKYEHDILTEQFKKFQEISLNNDFQTFLNSAIADYNRISATAVHRKNFKKYEDARKKAAEKVLYACNEVCQRFIAENLEENTFDNVYKSQIKEILDSDDLWQIYEDLKDKYPSIQQVLSTPVDE